MRIAHLADTHIRNLKYHREYRIIFDQLYDILREKKVDYIVHCGDICHTKTQISPEFVQMCSDFFRNLANIAPTHIIPGNHDGNLRNTSRLDALSPIVEALRHPSLFLHKDSGEVILGCVTEDKIHDNPFVLNILSAFDKDNWIKPTNEKAVNIALYHGAISNSKTDLGWIMEHGEDELSIFNDFDYAFLGDIHKTNQILDHKGRVRYPGSTIQQNHGETNDKGFLLWEIEDKDNFACEHISILNPKPFITVELTPKGRIPNKTSIPDASRLRLVSDVNLSLESVRKAVDSATRRFKPESITYLSKATSDTHEQGTVEAALREDLRDINIQETLIAEHLKDHTVEEETFELINKINKEHNSLIEQKEEVSRNINWTIKKLKWDNLFNYGSDNEINFENINGIVGIFGKNYSGKSSIVDSILYTLYNSTSKNNRKNLNIINQNKENCKGSLEIDIGHSTYFIERTSEKYTKNLKGEVTDEARTDLDFIKVDKITEEEKSLNGLSRGDTDKNIRKVFGTLGDFLITSMASQLDPLSFLGEGSTKRKEILAKFLDLEIFDKKYKMAKERATELKASLRNFNKENYAERIAETRKELALSEILSERKKKECGVLQQEIESKTNSLNELINAIETIPTEVVDIKQVLDQIEKVEEISSKINEDNIYLSEKLLSEENILEKINLFLKNFDIKDLQEKASLLEEDKEKLKEFEKEFELLEILLENQNQSLSSLEDVPCGPEYSHCKFIRNAHETKDKQKETIVSLNNLLINKNNLEKSLENSNLTKYSEHIEKYDQVLDKKNKVQNSINKLKLSIEKNKTKNIKISNDKEVLYEKQEEFQQNKDVIENLENLLLHRASIQDILVELRESCENCQDELVELYKSNGSLEEKISNLILEEEETTAIQKEYSSIDLYMKCMHSNGISYDIIKKKLPIINKEIAKVLTNIVDFEVFFENNGRKLDILIRHPKHDARPIEMGSGAEKTIASMAIRLALLNVSTLPKGDIFILDEPGTALDEENMEGFVRILEMIKTQFKTVILISHLDSLKDCVDQQIIIEKDDDGYASAKY